MPDRRRVLLAGRGDLFDEVKRELEDRGATVTGLEEPDDNAIREALESDGFDVVCVPSRDDVLPLRIALLVRHLDGEIPIVVTVYDRAMAAQLEAAVPHLQVTSLADVVVPVLAGPSIDPAYAEVRREPDGGLVSVDEDGAESPFEPPRTSILRTLATNVFTPYDRSARLMFYAGMALILLVVLETAGAMLVLDQGFADALYGATKSTATVGANEAVAQGPDWFKFAIVLSMLLTLLSAAGFTGGLIERLTSRRLTGLFGRRSVPRRDHVVVVGLGQIGLRLCVHLRECGLPVVAVQDHVGSEAVSEARQMMLPVVIGRGADPAVLRRLSLHRARALVAVTPEDLVNVETAMAARTINPDLRVVLRAGDGDVADETRSLLKIGHVVDAHREGARHIAAITLGEEEPG